MTGPLCQVLGISRNDEQFFLLSVGQSIITGPVLRRYGAEIRTDARLVGQPSHQGHRSNWEPHDRDVLNRENTMFFNARLIQSPSLRAIGDVCFFSYIEILTYMYSWIEHA